MIVYDVATKVLDICIHTYLSKALNHQLLIAKFDAYGLSLPALELIYDYLQNRRKITKISIPYSEWFEIVFGVPYSILGPLLFNIF